MDFQLLRCLLNNSFYTLHKAKLNKRLFSDEVEEVFEVIIDAQERYGHDLSAVEVFELWKAKYPTATRAEQMVVQNLIKGIEDTEAISEDIANDLIVALWKREGGRKIAEYGVAISEGKDEVFARLRRYLDQLEAGFVPESFGEPVTTDLEELLAFNDNDNRAMFNIPTLAKRIYGVGPNDFIIVFARPETGKTAFGVSLACAPGGFCEQGKRVFYGVNEEDPKKTMLRVYCSVSGMTKQEITINPKLAIDKFAKISNNLTMMPVYDWTIGQLDVFLEQEHFDIAIIDQLDKIKIGNNDTPKHERLRDLYTETRAIGNRYQTGIIAFSQASVDGEGKTILTPDMMEGSKTGKYAEADAIIGIGRYPDDPSGTPDPIRFLTVGKNKLSGWHGTEVCKLEVEKCRYVD